MVVESFVIKSKVLLEGRHHWWLIGKQRSQILHHKSLFKGQGVCYDCINGGRDHSK
jgi:hypothetical protein